MTAREEIFAGQPGKNLDVFYTVRPEDAGKVVVQTAWGVVNLAGALGRVTPQDAGKRVSHVQSGAYWIWRAESSEQRDVRLTAEHRVRHDPDVRKVPGCPVCAAWKPATVTRKFTLDVIAPAGTTSREIKAALNAALDETEGMSWGEWTVGAVTDSAAVAKGDLIRIAPATGPQRLMRVHHIERHIITLTDPA